MNGIMVINGGKLPTVDEIKKDLQNTYFNRIPTEVFDVVSIVTKNIRIVNKRSESYHFAPIVYYRVFQIHNNKNYRKLRRVYRKCWKCGWRFPLKYSQVIVDNETKSGFTLTRVISGNYSC